MQVKRRNQTFLFLCEATDSVRTVKERVVAAANQHCGSSDDDDDDDNSNNNKISADLLRLYASDTVTVLLDATLIKEVEGGLKDGGDAAVFYVVVQVADDEWEAVDVVSTEMDETAAPPVAAA